MKSPKLRWLLAALLFTRASLVAAGDDTPPVDAPAEEPADERIVGGFRAPDGSAPWQVELYSTWVYDAAEVEADRALPDSDPKKRYLADKADWERAHRCGGAYLGDQWVVTAAHCFNRVEDVLNSRRIRLGTQDLALGGATYRIERVVIHRDYKPKAKLHDIALIRIVADAGSVPTGSLVLAPIRILGDKPTDRALAEHDRVSVTGWGLTGARAAGSRGARGLSGEVLRSSAALMQVDLSNWPQDKCEAEYAGFLGPGVICAGSDQPGKDSCTGDSGGPLTRAQGRSERVLVGLVSWGKGCGLPGMPGIYTNVTHYRQWIEDAKRQSKPGAVPPL